VIVGAVLAGVGHAINIHKAASQFPDAREKMAGVQTVSGPA